MFTGRLTYLEFGGNIEIFLVAEILGNFGLLEVGGMFHSTKQCTMPAVFLFEGLNTITGSCVLGALFSYFKQYFIHPVQVIHDT